MFTPDEREAIRSSLIAKAQADPHLLGGAITGSASVGREDPLSDIDLAFGVDPTADFQGVIEDYTAFMETEHGAVHHLDVPFGAWVYRVFLLANTLQVDLAFVPHDQFGARGPTFKLLFGDARELPAPFQPIAEEMIGMAWLYSLHVRSSLGRGKLWQAEYMLSAMRDQVLTLACLRLGFPTKEARGFDALPVGLLARMRAGLPSSLDYTAIKQAWRIVTVELSREADLASPELATRLRPILLEFEA